MCKCRLFCSILFLKVKGFSGEMFEFNIQNHKILTKTKEMFNSRLFSSLSKILL